MKQYIPWIISLVCCVLVCLCMMKISDLQGQVTSMQSGLNTQISTLQSNINSIYANVDSKLKEQNNLLSASDYSFKNADPENGTVDVICTVTPKVFQPEGTSATIICNGKEYAMKLQDKQFIAAIPLSIYETSTVSSVSFQKDGTIQTQALDWRLTPRERFLPTMYANLSGSYTGTATGANIYTWKVNSSLAVDVEQKGGLSTTIEHIDLVYYVDGSEEERIELLGQHLSDHHASFGSSSAEVTSVDPLHLEYDIKRDFECPFGSTMRLCVEMTDGTGIVHQKLVETITITEDGQLADNAIELWHGAEANLLSEDGDLLYGVEWEDQTRPWTYQ